MSCNQKEANKLVSFFIFTVEINGDLGLKCVLTSACFLLFFPMVFNAFLNHLSAVGGFYLLISDVDKFQSWRNKVTVPSTQGCVLSHWAEQALSPVKPVEESKGETLKGNIPQVCAAD